jgi:DNA helicase-2/ATP-dependent DNA helicase PcrA
MPVAYLEKLNPEQRRAVEHGVRENVCAPTVPLLVIAGAGSGKTNMLAHRVAHPRMLSLMDFLNEVPLEHLFDEYSGKTFLEKIRSFQQMV